MSLTLDDLTPEQADTTRRDQYGRYKVLPPGGTKPLGYTRATTIAKTLEDQHSLIAWKARTAAKGLTLRPELLKMIAVEEDRKRIDDLVEQAAQAGGATERRDEGTALHRALELHLTGEPVPSMFRADVDAVVRAMDAHGLSVLDGMTERMCVLDAHTIAGTFDLIVKAGSTLYVADIKTGKSLDYSGLSFATQLAIYANADDLYTQGAKADGSLDTRDPMPPVDKAVALVLHVQPGSGLCEVHDVNINTGAAALEMAIAVRDLRNKGRKLITPRSALAPVAPQAVPQTRREAVLARIAALRAINVAALRTLADQWPDGVPELKSNAIYTKSQFDAIDDVLVRVEAQWQAPFPVGPAEDAVPSVIPARFAIPEPEVTYTLPPIDNGDPIDDDTRDAMLAKLLELDGDARAWVMAVLAQAKDANVPVSVRSWPAVRHFQITRALLAWAPLVDDDLCRAGLIYVLGADRVQPGFPLGGVLGALSADEAHGVAIVPGALDAGVLVYVVDAQGERIEPAAN